MRYAVILAGGRGTRFWPVSRKTDPKQLIPLLDGKTLLEATVERIAPLFPPERIVVAVTEQLAPKVAQALPRLPAENLVVEPAGRNTAPCIALAAREIGRRDRRATMAVFPADHYIPDQEAFLPILEAALRVAEEEGVLVTFGIRPDRPHTGYGYIERGEEVRRVRGVPIHRVRSFREKPNRAVAQRYLEAGNYAWNGGIFVWRTDIIEEEIATFLPDVAQGLRDIDGVSDSEERGRRLAEVYPTFPNISIDYAILEKSDRIVMVEIDTRWSDVGA
ncbi:MAG: mannose-1-phosphate guanylyltransferase, partial [Deltaproteobacteria bacterium]